MGSFYRWQDMLIHAQHPLLPPQSLSPRPPPPRPPLFLLLSALSLPHTHLRHPLNFSRALLEWVCVMCACVVCAGGLSLEPSIYAWALGVGRKSGDNFALPHRDYPHSEAFDQKGRATIINVRESSAN